MEKYIWHWKDSDRNYWRVTLEDSGERQPDSYDHGTKHGIWDYTFERSPHGEGETDWEYILSRPIVGQYNVAPNLLDVVQEFIAYFVTVGIGMTAHLESHPKPE